jgi:hypothetical protein
LHSFAIVSSAGCGSPRSSATRESPIQDAPPPVPVPAGDAGATRFRVMAGIVEFPEKTRSQLPASPVR